MKRLTRRSLLAASLVGTGAHLASRPVAAVAAVPPASAPAAINYFTDANLNLQTLFALGSAGYGISEVGEVLAAVDRVTAKGPSYQVFFNEFLALGRQLASHAEHAVQHGRRVTAREQYLRSAEYYSQALYFVLGTDRPTRARERAVYAAMQHSWDKATQLFAPRVERVRIPYGRITLPGYLLRPDDRRRPRPTVILNNGSDAQNVDLYAFGGAAALARGYNALIFEGPGQGSLLFERNVRFVPHWEHVVRPVVDGLWKRPDVERRRIAIVGWSFCGGSVARAAAFDHRLAAVVLDPGVNSVTASWNLGKLLPLANEGRRQLVNQLWARQLARVPASIRFIIAKRSEIFAQPSFYDQIHYMERFTLQRSLLRRITSPTLVMEAEDEQFYPGQSAAVYRELRSRKTLHHFTAAEGAQFHDEPMAPQLRNEVLYDWLDATLHL
jgi:hypothetical protein